MNVRVGDHAAIDFFDDVIATAVRLAAGELVYVPDARAEAQLVAAVRRGLGLDPRVRPITRGLGYALPSWTRPPGGIDLAADLADGTGRLAMEMKVGKPDESIWDAIKLADVQASDPYVRAGYLISDAYWSPNTEGSALFAHLPPRSTSCRDLISRFPRAWADTMVGGRGIRPRESVGGVHLTWLTEAPLAYHGSRRLVALRVIPDLKAAPESYDREGFPLGYEPPNGLRAKVRRADEARARASGSAAGDTTDPCHGYAWYERWSQHRIEAVLRSLGNDHAARACLRRRLALERNWQEHELRERFDPF